jgi:ferredoxin
MRFPPPEFSQPHPFPEVPNLPARPELFMYMDVAVLALALCAAAWLALRLRSRFGLVALMLCSIAYFGFWRKGCVCAIGSIQNVAQALADPGCALTFAASAFFVLPLAFALFFGRVFCAAVCPHGAIQDLFLLKPLRLPAWLVTALGLLPFVYLGAAALCAANGGYYIICRYDPFVPFFRLSGPGYMFAAGAAILALSTVVGRPYCRFVCPYGALLRLAQPLSWKRAHVTPDKCVVCHLCRDQCPYGAIRRPVPEPSHAERLRGRKRLAWALAAVPALMLAGAAVGYAAGPLFAESAREVRLAADVWGAENTPGPSFDFAAADGYLRTGDDPGSLFQAAAVARRRFRAGGIVFGVWFGAAAGLLLAAGTRQTARTDYDTDPAHCVSCARCFVSCPKEQLRISERRKGNTGSRG